VVGLKKSDQDKEALGITFLPFCYNQFTALMCV